MFACYLLMQFPGEQGNARIMSTEESLHNYLQEESSLTVTLMIGELKLATAHVPLAALITSQERAKVEGAFQLLRVQGNLASDVAGPTASSAGEAVVGICVELKRLKQEKQESAFGEKDKSKAYKQSDSKLEHLTSKSPIPGPSSYKRVRHDSDSSSNELSHSRNDSLSLFAARKQVKQDLLPPSKKRKLSSANEGDQDKAKEGEDKFWQEAHQDLAQWKEAQEKIFWKQVYSLITQNSIVCLCSFVLLFYQLLVRELGFFGQNCVIFSAAISHFSITFLLSPHLKLIIYTRVNVYVPSLFCAVGGTGEEAAGLAVCRVAYSSGAPGGGAGGAAGGCSPRKGSARRGGQGT